MLANPVKQTLFPHGIAEKNVLTQQSRQTHLPPSSAFFFFLSFFKFTMLHVLSTGMQIMFVNGVTEECGHDHTMF